MRPLLITGVPAVGKTTAFKKLREFIKRKDAADVKGFYVDEERQGGKRVGFHIRSIPEGADGKLADFGSDGDGRPKVGRWSVYIDTFEGACLPILKEAQEHKGPVVLMIDEIGKMELLSKEFQGIMTRLLHNPPSNMFIVCTIALRGQGLVDEAKKLPNVNLVEVTHSNRDQVLDMKLVPALRAWLDQVETAYFVSPFFSTIFADIYTKCWTRQWPACAGMPCSAA